MDKIKKRIYRCVITSFVICLALLSVNVDGNQVDAASGYNMKAVWVSYIDIQYYLRGENEAGFRNNFSQMCDETINAGCNTMIVQVRPFSDAIYPSNYFPWSTTISSDGSPLSYDPLDIMVSIAHSKGIKFEAWVNPFRISSSTSKTDKLKSGTYYSSNQIKYNSWKNSGMTHEYTYDGNTCLGLNPSNANARQLVIDGIKEIVTNYDVDGIVFDDYFYIWKMDNEGSSSETQARKNNINSLVRGIYSAIKSIDSSVTFGISPAGSLSNVRYDGADVDTWLSSSGYVDYIAPQLYFSNYYYSNYTNGYMDLYQNYLNSWVSINKNDTPMYVALALYKCGQSYSQDQGWGNSTNNLQKQWVAASNAGCEGYSLFSYRYIFDGKCTPELNNLNNTINTGFINTSGKYIAYHSHIQGIGWQNSVADGVTSGTSGQSKRIEAVKIKLGDKIASGNVTYRTYVQGYGWLNWVSNGSVSGTNGQSKRVEAIQVKLSGDVANNYDVYYRVYCQSYGWLDWAKNGETAGTMTLSKRVESIEVKLVPKGNEAPGATNKPSIIPGVSYKTHAQTYGWLSTVNDGAVSGTTGQGKRLEAINISLPSNEYSGDIQYRTYMQTYAWQNWVSGGTNSGVTGQSKRMEAIQIKLTGERANQYDVYYRVHAQSYGWLGWAKNGETAGTTGLSRRLEAIQIVLVRKGGNAPGSTANACIDGNVSYSTHVQTYGWQSAVGNGLTSGTVGLAKRLEAIKINLVNPQFGGSIEYRTHVQTYGWQNWVSNGAISGTSGQSKRLEAIQIRLTGDMANNYDIYYRVQCQTYGWMNWVKNGETAGTSGESKRLEAIQIKIVPKGSTP